MVQNDMKHLGLFEGIGGFSLAASWMGWETLAWCEINPFCQQILKHHFPNAIGHDDIKTTDFTRYNGAIDIITGGFPCQPFSLAGKRKGTDDERHLWPQMLRAIKEVKPRWVVGENVYGIVGWDGGLVFEQVQADLENEGYEVQAYILPAASQNAPHIRTRVWFVAHAESRENIRDGQGRFYTKFTGADEQGNVTNACNNGFYETQKRQGNKKGDDCVQAGKEKTIQPKGCGCKTNVSYTNSPRQQARGKGQKQISPRRDLFRKQLPTDWANFPTQPPVCSGDDGLPSQLDGITFSKWRTESLKAYGNAIVPQVVLQIYKAIEAFGNNTKNQHQ